MQTSQVAVPRWVNLEHTEIWACKQHLSSCVGLTATVPARAAFGQSPPTDEACPAGIPEASPILPRAAESDQTSVGTGREIGTRGKARRPAPTADFRLHVPNLRSQPRPSREAVP